MNYHYRHIREPGRPALVDLSIGFPRGETLRVLESPLANHSALRAAILTGRYRKPFIGENAHGRALYLSLGSVQSRMRFDDPWALDLLYTRKAMGFLLFQEETRDILLLGLGGGSLAKYCHRNLPAARIDVVEIDRDVIALGDYFCVPPRSDRFHVIQEDAARYVARDGPTYDVVIADAFDGNGIAPSLATGAFYVHARSRLRADGIFVSNLAGTAPERREHLSRMASAFSGNVLLVPVEGEGNEIVLGFNSAVPQAWGAIRTRAGVLSRRLGLDFVRIAGRFERSSKLGYARRALSR